MRVVIAATGTDIGKTHVTCALLAHLRMASLPALGWKPIASGGIEDAEAHARAGQHELIQPLYALAKPVSPHLAAREEGVTIELERLRARGLELERRAGVLVIETAGGLYSPLAPGVTNAELARALEPDALVLVAPDRLGVLHEVTACARAAPPPLAGVALSAPREADASTGTNAQEIEALGLARVLASFPRASWDEPSSVREAERLWSALLA